MNTILFQKCMFDHVCNLDCVQVLDVHRSSLGASDYRNVSRFSVFL